MEAKTVRTTAIEVIEDISANAFQILSRDDKNGLAKLIEAKLNAAGFVIVPKEPTEEMIAAGAEEDAWCYSEGQAPQPDIYRAMIAAYISSASKEGK